MNVDLLDRLLAEAAHLPPTQDVEQSAVRWAILLEDCLDVVLSDAQITSIPHAASDPETLRALLAASSPTG